MTLETKKLTAVYAGYLVGLAACLLFLDWQIVTALGVGIVVGRLTK
jgi:hypothetical protein